MTTMTVTHWSGRSLHARVTSPCPPAGALVVCLLLAGCRTGGGWTPAEPSAFERLPAESTGRWGSTTQIGFGDYQADSVKISWGRGGGVGVQVGGLGTDRAELRQEYRFSLRRAGGRGIPVVCHSFTRERNVGVRAIEMRTSARSTFDCDIRPGAGAAWQLALVEEGDDGFTGRLTSGDSRLTVHTLLEGNRVTGRRAAAYELRFGEDVVVIVDPRTRVVWRSHGPGSDELRDAAAAAAVALLLYQRPTQ
jgi:hypothetical protein